MKTRLLLLPLLLLAGSMLLRPVGCVEAAGEALSLWSQVVVPSLLPFFVLAELLIGLGGAQLAGRWLSPLMRPLFNLPGAAALAVVMGFCSGFPTGAAVTASLRREGLISAGEGARLTAFTNNAGPLYIGVAVSAGLLHRPQAAPLLFLGHYGLNIILGLLLGLLSRLGIRGGSRPVAGGAGELNWEEAVKPPPGEGETGPGAARPQPLAALLKTAAQSAAANLLLIGCYMTFFAVIAQLLTPAGEADNTYPLLRAILAGVWEMSLGVDALCDGNLPLDLLLPLIAAQLALGGASVQLQVLAMLAGTDISPRVYLLCRPLHALAAAAVTAVLLPGLSQPAAQMGTGAADLSLVAYGAAAGTACLLIGVFWQILARLGSDSKGFKPGRPG